MKRRALQPRHALPLVALAWADEQAGPNPKADAHFDKICRMLRDDLEAGEPWIVPIKGGVTLATTQD